MKVNGAETAKVTKCPRCKLKSPKLDLRLDTDGSGRTFIIFTCCNYVWVLELCDIGCVIADIRVKKDIKKPRSPDKNLTN